MKGAFQEIDHPGMRADAGLDVLPDPACHRDDLVGEILNAERPAVEDDRLDPGGA